jgi:hypothetical protein
MLSYDVEFTVLTRLLRSFPNVYGEQTYDFNSSKARALGLEFKGVEEMFDDAVDSLRGHGHLQEAPSGHA